ncbi:unnamed protein product, partial [Brenthis ino]
AVAGGGTSRRPPPSSVLTLQGLTRVPLGASARIPVSARSPESRASLNPRAFATELAHGFALHLSASPDT